MCTIVAMANNTLYGCPPCEETEPESSRTRTGERKGHSPYQFPQGQREEKEREEMLLKQKSLHVWKEGQIKHLRFATRHFYLNMD